MIETTTERTVPKMTSIRTAAKEINVSEYFIRQLVREGKIFYIKSGNKILLNYNLLLDFLNGKND